MPTLHAKKKNHFLELQAGVYDSEDSFSIHMSDDYTQ